MALTLIPCTLGRVRLKGSSDMSNQIYKLVESPETTVCSYGERLKLLLYKYFHVHLVFLKVNIVSLHFYSIHSLIRSTI